ncbi:hypothetical protein GGU11DRAFT_862273 [Lentinula aff. detonsa]|nr:hypothetical protein GGU11DRAFT_862273 [Lentinula aff. detonsa]
MSFILPSNPLPPIESGSETEGENSLATTAPPAHTSFPCPPHTAGVLNPRLPSSWSAPSGTNSAFPKDADEKLKGELSFVPWSKLFLGAVEYIGCKDILSASLKEHLNNFESALMSIRLAGHTVDEGFASAILVTTLPNEEGSPGSWHQWISNFKITSRTTIASTSAKIMGAYHSAHPEEGGHHGSSSSPNVDVESVAILMEHAFAASGKFYCMNCHTKGHSRDYCRQPGSGKHIPGGVGNGKKKGKKGKEKAHLVDSGGGRDTEQPSSTNFVSLSGTNVIDFSAYPASDLPASSNPLQPISKSVYPAGTTADRPPIIIDSAISQKVTGFGSGMMKIAGRERMNARLRGMGAAVGYTFLQKCDGTSVKLLAMLPIHYLGVPVKFNN